MEEKKSFFAKNPKGKEKKELNIEEIERKLKESEKLKKEYLAGWQRARADLLNYKKEELKRAGELVRYANANLILKILLILDNFEAAEKEMNKGTETKKEDLIKGFLQIKKQLEDFLKEFGVERIESKGKKFDPNFHEAVGEIEGKEEKEPGIIIEEVQRGYKINGQVLRPAKVKIIK